MCKSRKRVCSRWSYDSWQKVEHVISLQVRMSGNVNSSTRKQCQLKGPFFNKMSKTTLTEGNRVRGTHGSVTGEDVMVEKWYDLFKCSLSVGSGPQKSYLLILVTCVMDNHSTIKAKWRELVIVNKIDLYSSCQHGEPGNVEYTNFLC